MIDADDLAYCLSKAYPSLTRNKDYWVCHPVDSGTGCQSGTAIIVGWGADTPEPTGEVIASLWDQYGMDAIEANITGFLRARRNFYLSKADSLVAIAQDRDDADRLTALRAYRQALRDVPEQPGFPFSITWPEQPA